MDCVKHSNALLLITSVRFHVVPCMCIGSELSNSIKLQLWCFYSVYFIITFKDILSLQMENIGFFLSACESFGLTKQDLFQTVDLYEGENVHVVSYPMGISMTMVNTHSLTIIMQVINGLHALGRKVQKLRPDLPALGPKESDENKREFTQEQLEAGKGVIGLQMGSNKGASQAGSTPYGLGRQIEKTNLKTQTREVLAIRSPHSCYSPLFSCDLYSSF